MPKDLIEIKQFQTGTVTTPSQTDIPLDAASYSLNLDPVSENGKLEGMPNDMILDTDMTFKDSSSSKESLEFTKAAIINDSGVDNLITYKPSDNTFNKILGFKDGTTANTNRDAAVGSAIVSSSDEVSMEKNNKEVHIGTGNGILDAPKWCGIIPTGQFDTAAPSDLQLLDAELIDPGNFPDLYKVVSDSDGEFLYGIGVDDEYVYKFRVSTGAFVAVSDKKFTNTCGICMAGDGNIWVVDNTTGTTHILVKIDPNEMIELYTVQLAITFSGTCTNMHGGSSRDDRLSDIIEIGDYLWFSRGGTNDWDGGTAPTLLWNHPLSEFTQGQSTRTITDRTPWMGAASGTPGRGDWHDGAGTPDEYLVLFELPLANLADVSDDSYCGMMTVVETTAPAHPVYFLHSGTDSVQVHSCLQMVKYDSPNNTRLDSALTKGKLVRLDAVADHTSGSGGTKKQVWGFSNVGLGLLTYGINANVTSIKKFNNAGATTGKLTFAGTTSGGNTAGGHTALNDTSLKNAYAFSVDGTNMHVFDGYQSGRYAYGTISSLSTRLENTIEPIIADTTGSFSAGRNNAFFYKFSFTYDGYQESPLSTSFKTLEPGPNSKAISIRMNIRNLASLSKRVTHINMYRAASPNTGDAKPIGLYRLVKTFPLDHSWTEVVDSTSNPSWGNYRRKDFVDRGTATASYEGLNGVSEALKFTLPNYALSTQLNNRHYIAKCYHTEIDDTENYMFKSQAYNFDQFDWTFDLLRLPTIPTAIKAFQGRIYAFDENTTYKIEPTNFYIEDEFKGAGCHGPEAVLVTDYGLFYADKNNIYMHNGTAPTPIGTTIMRNSAGSSLGWDSNTLASDTRLIYDSDRSSVLVSFSADADGSPYYFWSYNISFKRWDLIKVDDSYKVQGHFTGRDGSIYLGKSDNYLYDFASSTSKRAWDWSSKLITGGHDTQVKKFKKFRITGSPSGSLGSASTGVSCKIDGSNVTETGSTTEWRVDNKDGKHCQVLLNGQTSEVDAIGIIFRRKAIK